VIDAKIFIDKCKEHGFDTYSGVPCSYLKPFINHVIETPDLRYIGAANEGEAVAIAAGSSLGGRRAIAMCQNSGLGNAVNPLTSLTYTFRIPILLITTLRGQPDGPADEPQHELMGKITTDMLELMQIPWEYFPTEADQVGQVIQRALAHQDTEGRPYALVMRKGSVAPSNLHGDFPVRTCTPSLVELATPAVTRHDMLKAVQAAASDTDVIVATTGYTGRELYACDDRPGQVYIVGSMGCASSFGLGLAAAQPNRRIIVIDGDGAALMRLGALCTLGYERPPNLVHVLLDNGIHESTGGQMTVSRSVNFCSIASASGYPRAVSVSSPDEMQHAIESVSGELTFVHAPIKPGIPDNLPRPSIKPPEVASRLRAFLQKTR
jgi:phosphonopyruvate decarboxylase